MSNVREFMLNFPAGKPPPGVKSNFVNPPNYYSLGLGIQGACIGLTTLGVISRICVKIFMMRDMRLEDYLIIVAYVFEIAHVGSAFYVMTFAPILHQWDIPIRNIIKFLKAVHLGSLTYDVTIVCLKLCILIQFKRIFIPAANRFAIRITHALMVANTLLFAVCVFTRIFACRPIQKQWDPLMKGGSCLNITLQMMFAGSFNLALDTLILLWTQAIIWRLNMPTKRRLKMAALFATGLVACASAAVRVHMVTKMLHTPDHAYYASWSALWSYPEATAGFLVLCLPVVPRIVKAVLQKAGLRSAKSSHSPQIASGCGSSEKPNRPQRSWWYVSGGDSQLQSGGSTAAFAVETPEIQVTKVIEIERADSMS